MLNWPNLLHLPIHCELENTLYTLANCTQPKMLAAQGRTLLECFHPGIPAHCWPRAVAAPAPMEGTYNSQTRHLQRHRLPLQSLTTRSKCTCRVRRISMAHKVIKMSSLWHEHHRQKCGV